MCHLQFADDTLIFCPAKRKNLTNIRRILECFQILSVLKINFLKSTLGKGRAWGEDMARKLGCKLVDLPITYLGIPLGRKSKKCSCMESCDKEGTKKKKKLATWKSIVLSRAGRLVLIKSVLNCLPLYYISLFKIPRKVVKRLVNLQRAFFSSGQEGKKGIALVKWETIQKPKHLGGLGVDNLIIKKCRPPL